MAAAGAGCAALVSVPGGGALPDPPASAVLPGTSCCSMGLGGCPGSARLLQGEDMTGGTEEQRDARGCHTAVVLRYLPRGD